MVEGWQCHAPPGWLGQIQDSSGSDVLLQQNPLGQTVPTLRLLLRLLQSAFAPAHFQACSSRLDYLVCSWSPSNKFLFLFKWVEEVYVTCNKKFQIDVLNSNFTFFQSILCTAACVLFVNKGLIPHFHCLIPISGSSVISYRITFTVRHVKPSRIWPKPPSSAFSLGVCLYILWFSHGKAPGRFNVCTSSLLLPETASPSFSHLPINSHSTDTLGFLPQ